MTELRAIVPAELEDRVAARLADCGYPDPGEYLLDLIRRDLEDQDHADSPEYIAWVRAKIAEAQAAPLIDRDPRDIIEDIIAKRHAAGG